MCSSTACEISKSIVPRSMACRRTSACGNRSSTRPVLVADGIADALQPIVGEGRGQLFVGEQVAGKGVARQQRVHLGKLVRAGDVGARLEERDQLVEDRQVAPDLRVRTTSKAW